MEVRLRQEAAITLVELLVVIAILGLLVTVALPNFLASQTRAKYSRVVSDLRGIIDAVNSYAVDHARVPRMTFSGAPFFDVYVGRGRANEPISATLGYWMTTPVAYLVKFDLIDPFNESYRRVDGQLYTYIDYPTRRKLTEERLDSPYDPEQFLREFGTFACMSIGPDHVGGAFTDFWTEYDPTNGANSFGNIWRSQRHSVAVFHNVRRP